MPQHVPPSRTCDLVLELQHQGRPISVIVEVQTAWDPDKVLTWPLYYFAVRARTGGDVHLVVITCDAAVARRAAVPCIDTCEAWFCPIVLGPGTVPRIATVAEATAHPLATVLSGLIHAGDEDVDVATATLSALLTMDPVHGTMLHDILWTRWSQRARDTLEALMTTQPYQFTSEFALRHFARGQVDGRIGALLNILEVRGLTASTEQRARIEACTELAVLDEWLRRAIAASSIDDVLA